MMGILQKKMFGMKFSCRNYPKKKFFFAVIVYVVDNIAIYFYGSIYSYISRTNYLFRFLKIKNFRASRKDIEVLKMLNLLHFLTYFGKSKEFFIFFFVNFIFCCLIHVLFDAEPTKHVSLLEAGLYNRTHKKT